MPYAVMSFWSMFNDYTNMSETLALFAPLMAKSACVWNPLIYVAMHQDFRLAFKNIVVENVSNSRRSNSPQSRRLDTKIVKSAIDKVVYSKGSDIKMPKVTEC